MAYGPVNVPGVTGAELTSVRQLAQNAADNASTALSTANTAKSTANAAMTKANTAETTANTANTTANAAQETANSLSASVQTAASNASTALSTANTANQTANNALTAAQNAQTTANAVSQALTELNSTISALPSQSGTLTYTGNNQTPSWNGYDSDKMTLSVTAQSAAGTYSATFTPRDGYKWWDNTTAAKTASWTIGKASLTVPAQSGTLTYNGSAQSPSWNSNYDSSKMTLSVTAQTDAGSYTASFTPKANYQWSDGTTTAKTVDWSIGKKDGSLSLNKSSLSLNVSSLTGTITATKEGGAVSATSSNTSVATVSVNGTTITVTGVGAGSATITVSVAADNNHTAPSNKTCSVTVTMPSNTLANNTPDVIKAAAQAGTASSYWSVGDKIGIALNGTVGSLSLNDTYYAFILGFNHNSSREGSNSIHFQFGKTASGTDIAFVDSSYNSSGSSAEFRMNTTNTNSGGWSSSYMRSTICAAFLSAMPSAWQSVIASCTKYSDNTGGGSDTASYVTSTSDKIWLLSEFEVQGSRTYANSAEKNYQAQYSYYANGNSKVKYKHNSTGSTCYWWLRSVNATYTAYFCYVNTDGSATSYNAYRSNGFAPGFKVA